MDSVNTEQVVEGTPIATDEKYVSRRGRRMLAALLVILLIILLIAGVLLTQLLMVKDAPDEKDLAGVTWIRSIYGYGPAVEQMTEPASVAIDPDGGTIWLADQGRFRIVKYDPNGRYLDQFSGDGTQEGNFRYPSRIALSPDGWLYVVQSTYNNVKVYDPQGRLRQTIEIPSPMSVAVNDEMVIIGAQSGFAAYDRQGKLIGIVGQRGDGKGEFDTVNGVALDDESNAYIVDSFNNRISKYNKEGDVVWTVETGRPGNKAGSNMDPGDREQLAKKYPAMMQIPMGATIDGAGRLIVIDLLDFSIVAFDTKDGRAIDKWGTWGRDDGKFLYSADIDYDPAYDWFVVSDSGNQRAQIIRLPGSGGSVVAAARRFLAGPVKACLIPLFLLLLLLVIALVFRNRKKKRELQAIADAEGDAVDAPANGAHTV